MTAVPQTVGHSRSIRTLVARRAGIDRRELERLFQRTLQMSPARFYRSLRLRLARRMLADPGRSVSAVAAACGFGSASALARAMRRDMGVTPQSLREGVSP